MPYPDDLEFERQSVDNEIVITKGLSGMKHFVTVYDNGLCPDVLFREGSFRNKGISHRVPAKFIVMEQLNMNFKQVIKMGNNDENHLKWMIRECIDAINYLFKMGIIHGDLHLENIMTRCSTENIIDMVIIDFGKSEKVENIKTYPNRFFDLLTFFRELYRVLRPYSKYRSVGDIVESLIIIAASDSAISPADFMKYFE
jgi:tRNA A-37 threonylcarbamoyl transferase component Bud32